MKTKLRIVSNAAKAKFKVEYLNEWGVWELLAECYTLEKAKEEVTMFLELLHDDIILWESDDIDVDDTEH